MFEVQIVQERLARYIKTISNSVIAVELLAYFYRNPSAMDTCRGLGHWIGRSPDLLQPILDELVESGLLEKSNSKNPVYRFTRDKEARALVEEFVIGLMDESGRLRLAALLEGNSQ